MMSTYVDCRPNSECGLQLCSKVDTYLIKRACNDSSETLLFLPCSVAVCDIGQYLQILLRMIS